MSPQGFGGRTGDRASCCALACSAHAARAHVSPRFPTPHMVNSALDASAVSKMSASVSVSCAETSPSQMLTTTECHFWRANT